MKILHREMKWQRRIISCADVLFADRRRPRFCNIYVSQFERAVTAATGPADFARPDKFYNVPNGPSQLWGLEKGSLFHFFPHPLLPR
jgi:hypothetical protein